MNDDEADEAEAPILWPLEWAVFLFRDLPDPRNNTHLLHLQVDSLPLSHHGSPQASPSLNSFS